MADHTQLEILRQNSSTREDLGMLAVMDAIESRDRVTQRELARLTGLTLKKVNYSLRKLLEKGHVKFLRARSNPDRRAYLYILTPAGFRAKSRLTYRFLKFTMDFYGRVEEKLRSCLSTMNTAGVRRVVLYGATDVARIVLDLASGHGVEVVGVTGPSFKGRDYHGLVAIGIGRLGEHEWDAVLITDLDDPDESTRQLIAQGVAEESIWTLS